ncbi:transcriptional regulation of mitochondrial recombination-domain-containing protein [Podospora australis]|uniref:Large ribosomal subunit protein mL67 n=1 Tax=Podospora australis TaxID=1536484 RepID=A0AAN7AD39_9PEZI|nr:transcriptional regulation of mitochondrial recombination-domain-containing protein [Podospora australis]
MAKFKKGRGYLGEQKDPQPEGHGERIWIFSHIMEGHVVWSFTPDMRVNKAFRQFPYTGKKNVPAKLRKDYWRPMAILEFPKGLGDVGRSVYHKCRELKKRHELEWEDESLLNMTKRQRGRELNDQKANTVADIAYVLAGNGKGNKVPVTKVVKEEIPLQGKKSQSTAATAPVEGEEGEGEKKEVVVRTKTVEKVVEELDAEGKKKLHEVTVYWANEQDRYYAESWSKNVSHVVGLPERVYTKREDPKKKKLRIEGERKAWAERNQKGIEGKVEEVAQKVVEKVAEDKVAA